MRTRRHLRLAFGVAVLGFSFVCAELAIRGYFAYYIGPRVLAYGTPFYRNEIETHKEENKRKYLRRYYRNRTVEFHEESHDGYTKFFPNETKLDKDPETGEVFRVRTNSQGFRGPEFDVEKGDVLRVLTLGASSTFGYYNRNDTTYPHYLREYLNARCGEGTLFEVINFAIPHATAGNIYAMLRAEGLALKPDIITLYSGANDSTIRVVTERNSFFDTIGRAAQERLLLTKYVGFIYERRSNREADYFDADYARVRSDAFLKNVKSIVNIAEDHGIKIIIATQQLRSLAIPREELRGVTYDQELKFVMRRAETGQALSRREVSFLIHGQIMKDLVTCLEGSSRSYYVDVREILDQHRDYLFTHVHLHPDANQMVARAFGDEILRRACPLDKITTAKPLRPPVTVQ